MGDDSIKPGDAKGRHNELPRQDAETGAFLAQFRDAIRQQLPSSDIGQVTQRGRMSETNEQPGIELLPQATGDSGATLTAGQFSRPISQLPKQIGPYHILGLVSDSGGMGTVYKAEQRSPILRTVA